MSRFMGTFDIKGSKRLVAFAHVFVVAFNSYLHHQILHEDVDVLRGDDGVLHWSFTAHLAVLTEAPHLDNAPPVYQVHVEDHHHPVGRPASSTCCAFKA